MNTTEKQAKLDEIKIALKLQHEYIFNDGATTKEILTILQKAAANFAQILQDDIDGTSKVVDTSATAENGLKCALIGDFKQDFELWSDEADGTGIESVTIDWPNIKDIYKAAIRSAPDRLGAMLDETEQ